jgi:hypothetical protein
MFASAIGIDADLETDVGTVVAGDDRAADVAEEERFRSWNIFRIGVGIGFKVNPLESIGRIVRRPSTAEAWSLV